MAKKRDTDKRNTIKEYIREMMRTGASGRQMLVGIRKAGFKISDRFVYSYLREWNYKPRLAKMYPNGQFGYQKQVVNEDAYFRGVYAPFRYRVSAVFILPEGQITFKYKNQNLNWIDRSSQWLNIDIASSVPYSYNELREDARDIFFDNMESNGSEWQYAVFVVHEARYVLT